MYRHRKHWCKNRSNLSSNNSIVTSGNINDLDQSTPQSSQVTITDTTKYTQPASITDDTNQRVISILEKTEQTQKLLMKTIEDLKNHLQQVNNNTNNYNLTFNLYFNNNEIDLYEIKKQLLGEQGAKNFLMGLVHKSTPNNKFQWFHDMQIFKSPTEIPIRVVDKRHNKLIIHNRKDSEIIDIGGVELNRICNAIVGKSYMRAVSEDVRDTFEKNQVDIDAKPIERQKPIKQSIEPQLEDRIESRIGDLLSSDVLSTNPAENMIKYERPPTVKHLKDTIEFLCQSNDQILK